MMKFSLLILSLALFNISKAQDDYKLAEMNKASVKKQDNPKHKDPKNTKVNDIKKDDDDKDDTLKPADDSNPFTLIRKNDATSIKNQAITGTCWCFSSTSLLESMCLKKDLGEYDISEMFTVRNIYVEKARNYILRQGHAQFGQGGLGHDLIRAVATYGAVPESIYSGLKPGQKMHNHVKLEKDLKVYLDNVLKTTPLQPGWINGYTKILDSALGVPPTTFEYLSTVYTPKSFAKDLLKFNPDDYVNITSFTHHPYYEPFVIEVPDNFSNGAYYNLPLNEMIQQVKYALKAGYTVLWDADVSNRGFMQDRGIAMQFDPFVNLKGNPKELMNGNMEEMKWDADIRQKLFEDLTTQDDHLMHITGMETSSTGKIFFLVKNSWGDIGPAHGYINVSEAYLAINTISLIIPKAALSNSLLEKLKIK